LAVVLAYLWIMGLPTAQGVARAVRIAILRSGELADDPNAPLSVIGPLFASVVPALLLMLAILSAVVLLFELLQTGIVFSAQPLKPDFSRLNPATGFKRLFSVRLLLELLKSILKMCFYGAAAYFVIRHALAADIGSVTDAHGLVALLARATFRLLAIFAVIALFFAVLDQLIVRRQFLKKMSMSRREIKREARDREGDPRLKQKRKKLHAEFSKLRQSLHNLRGADVVVTNPEHIAIALRYDRRTMPAPRIVSVGTNRIAQYLKRLALLYGIPVVENRDLARALYSGAVLNSYVPEHCFGPVADIYNTLRLTAGQKQAGN
jgi:flagellar biosynthetic protein FlhB